MVTSYKSHKDSCMNGGERWIPRAQTGCRDVKRNNDTFAAEIFLDSSDLSREKAMPVLWSGEVREVFWKISELSLGRMDWSLEDKPQCAHWQRKLRRLSGIFLTERKRDC